MKNFDIFLSNINKYQFVGRNKGEQQKNIELLNYLYKKA
jgi:hypothetical protein